MANKKNQKRKKKRQFAGNKYTTTFQSNSNNDIQTPEDEGASTETLIPEPENQPELEPEQEPQCSSSRKIYSEFNQSETDTPIDFTSSFNMIIDFTIFENIIHSVARCKICKSNRPLVVENIDAARKGFALKLKLSCSVCTWSESFYTSKPAKDPNEYPNGSRPFSVNYQMVTAFREIGKGYEPLKNFSRLSNMHCVASKTFHDINSRLMTAYKSVASESMQKAGKEVLSDAEKTEEGKGLCRVLLDGSWQRRGHASLNGLVTAISKGKCIDVDVMSKFCRGCAMWQSKKGTIEYDQWKADHVCVINHTKSSGAMEGAGAVKMFQRSIEKHDLIYNEYLGDGDTSSFKEVVEAEPYKNQKVKPNKQECVGHVQKRLGTRLRKVVKDYRREEKVMKKGKMITKIIKLSGKGKLTDTMINSMQNYYGMAIRGNIGNLYAMKKAIGAVLFHCTEFESPQMRHKFCPSGPDTWCKWQLDKLNGTNNYKPRLGIPKWIHDVIYPIFVELRDDSLLTKCLHGQTQNPNEALNQIIWSKVPKAIFVGKHVLEMGINSAIIEYNDGAFGIHKVLNHVGVETGLCTHRGSVARNKRRLIQSARKCSAKGIQRRKTLRTIKKGFLDQEKELEKEESYVAGGFPWKV